MFMLCPVMRTRVVSQFELNPGYLARSMVRNSARMPSWKFINFALTVRRA
jgi:hypothetical protein